MRWPLRSHGDARGQALVEFALILPVFILLLVGLFDLGRGVYAFNTISNASREAVRLAIVDQDCSLIVDKAVNRAASLGLSASNVAVWIWDPTAANAGNWDPTYRSACGSSGTASCPQSTTGASVPIGCVVEVDVTYRYVAATPIIGQLLGAIDMKATTRQPIERTCNSTFLQPPSTCQEPAS